MASDYLLEIEGVKGESQDDKHKETIEISSFSWGLSNAGSFQSGGGGGSGKANFQDIHFTTTVSKASPKLAEFCAIGKHVKKASLFVRKQGGKQEDFYTIVLEDLLVSSYQSGGHEGSTGLPTDQFSLNYAKIDFGYKMQDAKGAVGGPTNFKYDLKANKAV